MNFFNKIISGLLSNIKDDKTSLEYKRIKTLSVFLTVSFFLIVLIVVKTSIIRGIDKTLMSALSLFIISVTLIFIKIGKNKLAENFVSLSLTAEMIFAMFANVEEASMPYFMTAHYYIFFVLIIFTAMFASRYSLIISSIIIVITTSIIFFINKENIPADIKKISTDGYFLYEIMIIMISVLSIFFTNFINKVVNDLSENSKQLATKNTGMLQIIEKSERSSKELVQASEQFSSISQELSRGANQQSSETEAIAASIHNILDSINSNTAGAEETSIKSSKASKELDQSSKVILETLDLVKQISQKTSIISDIAFQTNILSLNASIQAAKAGKAGKGFAVVADEIRELAEKSKNASEEIEELIETSTSMTSKADKALSNSLNEINEISESTEVIAKASKEQLQEAGQIDNSIKQLTELTTQNSASSEEMSASAEELFAQAESLKEIVEYYNKIN